jgi:YbgC/YbaW family acyl-CoA thioester hydrolase
MAPRTTVAELSIPVDVEFEDVDSYRIAHHTKLLAYLERARVRFLSRIGVRVGDGPCTILLYGLTVRFVKPARLLDKLQVSVRPSAVDAVRLTLDYRIRRGKELVLKASSELAFADPQSCEIVPVPPSVASKVKAMMAARLK